MHEKESVAKVSPAKLVYGTLKLKRPNTWDALKPSEKAYINAVVDVIKKNPGTSVYRVADALISELSLTVSQHTMVRILKGLLNDKT